VIQAFNDMVPKLEDHLRMHASLQLATESSRTCCRSASRLCRVWTLPASVFIVDETGGDYYDYLEVSKDPWARRRWWSRCVGHGVYAALLMAWLARSAAEGHAPRRSCGNHRRREPSIHCRCRQQRCFMTLFYLAIDSTRKAVRWVRAGHDPAIVYDPGSQSFEELSGRGIRWGWMRTPFSRKTKAEPQAGGVIFIGTDGIWETAGPDGRLFERSLRETHSQHL